MEDRKEQPNYFAHVFFGRNEKEGQRDFLRALNGAEIIFVSKEEIDEWYNEDVSRDLGNENHIVLHGEEEKNRFRYIMDTFFPKKEYQITDDPENQSFQNWLKKKTH